MTTAPIPKSSDQQPRGSADLVLDTPHDATISAFGAERDVKIVFHAHPTDPSKALYAFADAGEVRATSLLGRLVRPLFRSISDASLQSQLEALDVGADAALKMAPDPQRMRAIDFAQKGVHEPKANADPDFHPFKGTPSIGKDGDVRLRLALKGFLPVTYTVHNAGARNALAGLS